MSVRTTVADVLTALPIEGDDFHALYDLVARTEYDVLEECEDGITFDVSAIVNPLVIVAATAIELCASRSGATRAEVIFDLRRMLADTSRDPASTDS